MAVAARRDRTLEFVIDWLIGAAALRRAMACRGGGVAATTRGGRQTRCRPGVDGK